MDNDESAQMLADGIRINYTFIRPHMGLDGKTPAQVAGLHLQLQGIRWMSLVKHAISRSTPTRQAKGEAARGASQ